MIKHSESIDQLATALSQAQGELKDAVFDSTNHHFRNDYASLGSMYKAIRPIFSKYGLSFCQVPNTINSLPILTTTLMHKSGQWMEADLELFLKNKTMQDLGSANTYGKRQHISGFAGIYSDFDDDGNTTLKEVPKDLREPIKSTIQPKPKMIPNAADSIKITQTQAKALFDGTASIGWNQEQTIAYLRTVYKIASSSDITQIQYAEFTKEIISKKKGFDSAIFDAQKGPQ